MSVDSVVRAGRAAAERLMVATVNVERPSGDPDPLTGLPSRVPVYEGRGKVQSFRAYESSREVGGATVTDARREVHVPWDSGPYQIGDLVTVVASPTQPHLVGQTFRVAFPDEKSMQTAQRLLVDQ